MTSSRHPCQVYIADLVARNVYVWLRASSVPKISAVPERTLGKFSIVLCLEIDERIEAGHTYSNFDTLAYGNFEPPF